MQRVRVNRSTGTLYTTQSSVDTTRSSTKEEPTIIERIKEVFVEVPRNITVPITKTQVVEKVVTKYSKLSFAIGFIWGSFVTAAAVIYWVSRL